MPKKLSKYRLNKISAGRRKSNSNKSKSSKKSMTRIMKNK